MWLFKALHLLFLNNWPSSDMWFNDLYSSLWKDKLGYQILLRSNIFYKQHKKYFFPQKTLDQETHFYFLNFVCAVMAKTHLYLFFWNWMKTHPKEPHIHKTFGISSMIGTIFPSENEHKLGFIPKGLPVKTDTQDRK